MRSPKNTPPPITAGQVFDFPYPFCRDTFIEMDSEGRGEVPCWKPGVRSELEPPDGGERVVADAFGSQIVTVIGVFRPGRFPTRVFYTRKWRDPNGKEFGKNACRVVSISGFRSIVGGYRHPFSLEPQAVSR